MFDKESKMKKSKIASPWVLLNLNNITYAISCESVLSLNQLPEVTSIPVAPLEIRGVINFRGKIIQLVDTRKILNIKTVMAEINEFDDLMNQRCQDHLNWIKNLEKTVIEDNTFTLQTNPHKCAFGKWYDSYNSKNTDLMFVSTFAKFDKPHQAIHQIGVTAEGLIKSGNKKAAIELIESTKNTELKQMLHLFDDLKEAYKSSRKEIVVVIGSEDVCIGLSVDQITAIEHLYEIDEDLIKQSISHTEYLAGYGKRKDGSVVFLLNDDYIIDKFH